MSEARDVYLAAAASHVQVAEKLLNVVGQTQADTPAGVIVGQAQVHATLALACIGLADSERDQ